MDPNENLRQQLQIANRIHLRIGEAHDNVDVTDDARELAELVLALHDWIAGGGFRPDAWIQ